MYCTIIQVIIIQIIKQVGPSFRLRAPEVGDWWETCDYKKSHNTAASASWQCRVLDHVYSLLNHAESKLENGKLDLARKEWIEVFRSVDKNLSQSCVFLQQHNQVLSLLIKSYDTLQKWWILNDNSAPLVWVRLFILIIYQFMIS